MDYNVLVDTDFLDALLDLVGRGKKRIYIATYLATSSPDLQALYYALARKRREGVDVKVILDGVSEEAKRYNKETIDLLRKLGVPVSLTKKFMHVKLYIVDSTVILGSHNLTGRPRRRHHELSVLFESPVLSDRLASFYMSLTGEPATMVIRDSMEDGTYFEIYANYPRALVDLAEKIEYASDRVKIMMYVATMSKKTKKIYDLLAEKVREGVDVTVVLDGGFTSSRRFNTKVYEYLRSIGVEKTCLSAFHVHAKTAVIDDFTMIGSHNLSSSSIAGRIELLSYVKHEGAASVISKIVDKVYNESSAASPH